MFFCFFLILIQDYNRAAHTAATTCHLPSWKHAKRLSQESGRLTDTVVAAYGFWFWTSAFNLFSTHQNLKRRKCKNIEWGHKPSPGTKTVMRGMRGCCCRGWWCLWREDGRVFKKLFSFHRPWIRICGWWATGAERRGFLPGLAGGQACVRWLGWGTVEEEKQAES